MTGPPRAVERLRAENAAPAERVDDERRLHVAAVGPDAALDPSLHERALESRVTLRPQEPAQLRVVEGRPAPREAVRDTSRAAS